MGSSQRQQSASSARDERRRHHHTFDYSHHSPRSRHTHHRDDSQTELLEPRPRPSPASSPVRVTRKTYRRGVSDYDDLDDDQHYHARGVMYNGALSANSLSEHNRRVQNSPKSQQRHRHHDAGRVHKRHSTRTAVRRHRRHDYAYHENSYNEKHGQYVTAQLDDGHHTEVDPLARKRRRKKWLIYISIVLLSLTIILAVAVGISVAKKTQPQPSTTTSSSGKAPSIGTLANSELGSITADSIPSDVKDTILDPFSWYDTADFNVSFTRATLGGLSIMGLNSTWDDTTRANANVPPLNEPWPYGKIPIRGVNLGGWLSIEPYITPSLFAQYSTHDDVVDEWTLCQTLGPSRAKSTLEQHYSSFVNEASFAGMQAAGLDHVRIPFSYWAVTTYDGDPYVPQVSWRYLLRAIEWARKHGLRINLDLHGAPGSQNGWNHSGHQGAINWLNGKDGELNARRTLDIHNQLSTFFAQPRYKNIISIYGLVNEPRMTSLDTQQVMTWTSSAIDIVRNNNMTAIIAFGDGFLGLDKWQGQLSNYDNLVLDVHQYVIFNTDQLALNHHNKTVFACGGWSSQTLRSSNPETGFGPTLCGEWSQADTDCAPFLNNVGVGSRWQGTLNTVNTPGGSLQGSTLNPTCPTDNSPRCSCTEANADPSTYSAVYKQWLRDFAEAQMESFEKGLGWFYHTWRTESAVQWSYESGLKAGILPAKSWERTGVCGNVPDYAALGLVEYY